MLNVIMVIIGESIFDDEVVVEKWLFGVFNIFCWFCLKIYYINIIGCKKFGDFLRIIDYLDFLFFVYCKDVDK